MYNQIVCLHCGTVFDMITRKIAKKKEYYNPIAIFSDTRLIYAMF